MPIAQKTMVAKTCMLFHVLMLLFWFSSHASFSSSTLIPRETICSFTPFPEFCGLSLPSNKSASVHEYGRFSVLQSLSRTGRFLSLVNQYLRLQFPFSKGTIHALQDCQNLASLNKDFLYRTIQAIGSTASLSSLEAEDIHTLLSATLTNFQTCLDGLQETSSPSAVQNALLAPLTTGCKSFSVSLALFLHGWGSLHRASSGRELKEMKFANNGELPVTTKSHQRRTFRRVNGRKILQNVGDGIKVRKEVVVNPNGSGNFKTINDAVDAAPNNAAPVDGYFLIRVVAGVYQESVDINKTYIMMVGDGINRTIITGSRSVADHWTTFDSATFAVSGTGFVAINITFQNTAGAAKFQAVALRNSADRSAFYKCSFEAYQDTLLTHSMRQFYRDCDVYGTIDFIFGDAAAVFQNCNLYLRLPMKGQFNVITAQGRIDQNQNSGISIQKCTIKAAPDLASSKGSAQTFLGRPWQEYSRTVYMQSYMDTLIDPAGWTKWSGDSALSTLYYGEYMNSGPGKETAKRVSWPGYHVMNENEAANFTVVSFIQGDHWLKKTGVSYTSGLSKS